MREKDNKKVVWFIIFIGMILLTVYMTIKQSESFTMRGFASFIKTSSWGWVIMAFLCMLGFIFFEAMALYTLCKAFGYKRTFKRNVSYSSVDIYFSAITPSATGGQPAVGYFMVRDQMPGAVATIILLVNLILYSFTMILISTVCFIARPGILMEFGVWSKILIFAGYAIQFVLFAVVILLIYQEKIVMRIASVCMKLLHKLHLMKNIDEKLNNLVRVEKQYKECAAAIKEHKKALGLTFVFNLLQRISQIMVTACVFLAKGGSLGKVFDVFITQGYVTTGANCVPIPGAVGAADYLFLDGFSAMTSNSTYIELFSRGISFYSCILICGIITLIVYIRQGLKGMRQKKNDRNI